ncbi:reverse transcriptase domain-containing protein [Gaoshiqia sediminis]|uniref:Reverse transcriptase domain-containing protein n=1 Tax=Gaoshiqia sediminis TaxID=2986998 RepID=A0AA42C793_9BACT|nr:reverse transcriptase domain-containing protein [Gaoshiqia sediminis]MCW0484758.1 reverse transcriptase domain-containing protein [Gaoshiqia sediminis]
MKNKDWFKVRGYRHIDSKITLNEKRKVLSKLSNPEYVAKHAFLPLIYKTITERKYKKLMDSDGVYYRSHFGRDTGESTKKVRPIHYACHIDAQIYAYYNHKILSSAYEDLLRNTTGLSDCISAYRSIVAPEGFRNKSNVHFAKDAFDEVRKRGECIAIALDVKSFFSTLDHKILLERWKEVLGLSFLPPDHFHVYKSITQFRYVSLNDFRTVKGGFDEREISNYQKDGIDAFFRSMTDFRERLKAKEFIVRKNQFHKEENGKRYLIGIPQGLPISALLANIYMYRFDLVVYNELCLKRNVFYRRYSDDIVLVCSINQREYVESFIREKISGELAKLKLSENKTERTIFEEFKVNGKTRLQSYALSVDGKKTFNIPFNYLGFQFYGYQTLIKNNRVSNFYRRMKRAVRVQHIKADKAKEKSLIANKVIYKTRLYRLFSYKGVKKRELSSRRRYILTKNRLDYWTRKPIDIKRRHRGNALKYAQKAAEIMDAPEINRQYRNHFRILQDTIKKYNFDNLRKD